MPGNASDARRSGEALPVARRRPMRGPRRHSRTCGPAGGPGCPKRRIRAHRINHYTARLRSRSGCTRCQWGTRELRERPHATAVSTANGRPVTGSTRRLGESSDLPGECGPHRVAGEGAHSRAVLLGLAGGALSPAISGSRSDVSCFNRGVSVRSLKSGLLESAHLKRTRELLAAFSATMELLGVVSSVSE